MTVLELLLILTKRMALQLHERGVERTPHQVFRKFYDDARRARRLGLTNDLMPDVVRNLLINCLQNRVCFEVTLHEFRQEEI